MSKQKPPKKQQTIPDSPIQKEDKSPQKSTPGKLKIKQRLSINSQNFVMCRVGTFDEHYSVCGKLGQGTFGTVYRVKHKTLHLERALKMIKKRGKSHFSAFEEIEVLKKLDHINILKIYQFYEAPEHYYIITDIFEGKELFDVILEQDKLTQSEAAHIMKETLCALNYTHAQKIAHRDMKPENILVRKVGDNYKIKVIDWGLGTLMGNGKANRVCGTPEYVAPQVLKGNYSIACDMWSVGAITFVMLTGQMPFTGKDTQDTIQVVKKGVVNTNIQAFKFLSPEAQKFITGLMNKNQTKRMTAVQALQHPWIVKNTQDTKSPVLLKQTLQRLRDFKVESKFGTAVISYINNHMSQEIERQKLQQIFKFLDINSDGVLSIEELISGYSNIYGKQMGKQIAQETFSKLDINHNGTLQFSQFVTFGLKQKHKQQENNLKEAFNLFDRDHNGKISKEEIQMVIKGNTDNTFGNQIDELIGEIDKNGDQEIDVEEFMKCINEFHEEKVKKKGKSRKERSAKK